MEHVSCCQHINISLWPTQVVCHTRICHIHMHNHNHTRYMLHTTFVLGIRHDTHYLLCGIGIVFNASTLAFVAVCSVLHNMDPRYSRDYCVAESLHWWNFIIIIRNLLSLTGHRLLLTPFHLAFHPIIIPTRILSLVVDHLHSTYYQDTISTRIFWFQRPSVFQQKKL